MEPWLAHLLDELSVKALDEVLDVCLAAEWAAESVQPLAMVLGQGIREATESNTRPCDVSE